jgi:hypothetical protein
MAFDQSTRGRLQKLVNSCRGLLSDEFSIQLQQTYGLDPKTGEVTPMARLTHLDDRQRHTAEVLRQTLAHYLGADVDDTDHRIAVLDRMVREQAFTVLNRLAALLMMEARGQMMESVSKGYQSRGYQLYTRIAGTALGETGGAYRVYLFSVFDELAQELPALFDRYAANGLLFPRETALRALLDELNHFEVEPLWSEDETIGWIYQYFNSQDERKSMRKASQAPRNSRELAVRNQFFTPRYVVEHLVDNTLGRLWFTLTGGNTGLRQRCQYLLTESRTEHGPQVKVRDPRTLKLLDPACGSMHFGLYAFDLFLAIYREAWAWERENGPGSLDVSAMDKSGLKPLSQTYADEDDFLRDVPRLIIEYNIYGVDIDPRAAQIATLALWLRAQRAWQDAGVKAKDRPRIGTGHVIAATAPPAEREYREQFSAQLDPRDSELFRKTLQMLKYLPEMGVLLQVERELPHLIRQAYVGTGSGLFAQQEQESWQQAEARLRTALEDFSRTVNRTYQGRLFAQDALHGLRLIDLCRESFDVVVMNPPFGLPSVGSSSYINENYQGAHNDIYSSFVARALTLCPEGFVGCITSSSFLLSPRLEEFRSKIIVKNLICVVDFGLGVMDDAMVRAAAYVLSRSANEEFMAADAKASLNEIQANPSPASLNSLFSVMRKEWFSVLPQSRLLIDAPQHVRDMLAQGPYFEPIAGTAREGMKTFDNERFIRLPWEVNPQSIGPAKGWRWLSKGGEFSFFYSEIHLLLNWKNDGAELKEVNLSLNGSTAQVRQASTYWGLPGATYSRRSSGFSARALPIGCIFTSNGPGILPLNETNPLYMLGWLNSRPIRALTHLNAGAYDNYSTGALKKLPWKAPTTTHSDQMTPMIGYAVSSAKQAAAFSDECSRWFFSFPIRSTLAGIVESINQLNHKKKSAECDALNKADQIVADVYQFRGLEWTDALLSDGSGGDVVGDADIDDRSGNGTLPPVSEKEAAANLISYLVGVVFGRWMPNRTPSEAELLALDDPFSTPPAAPPASIRLDGQVNSQHEVIALHQDGVADLAAMIREFLRINAPDQGDIEASLLAALGVKSLWQYLSGDFFDHHLQKYTASKRQAPIYWPLAVPSKRLILWFYYPLISAEALFKGVNDIVEPKIRQVGADLMALRNKGSARSRDDEKQFELLQTFEHELTVMRDTLLKIAATYQPNVDDGVQISAAPLWPLFRHKPWQKVLKDTWTKLEKGDYDWAHLAMAYWPGRVQEKCKLDKSLAIAHVLENLYVEPEAAPKKIRGRKKAGGEQ